LERASIPRDPERVTPKQAVAQIPFRSLKRIFDHSEVRFTANPKLALWAQTLGLRAFRFTKNGYQKFFNVRSRDFGNNPESIEAKGQCCSPKTREVPINVSPDTDFLEMLNIW